MANLKISQLPAATTPVSGSELIPIVQGGVTSKTSISNLFTFSSDFQLSDTIVSLASNISANAATATALQTARTIGGVLFDGSAGIVPQTIQSVAETTDTTCYPLFIMASGSQSLQPLNNSGFIYNASANSLTATTFIGTLAGNASTATTAETVTTNANLTGVITSSGNTTSIASQTGTGSKFVVDGSPTLITPNIGAAIGTSLVLSDIGQFGTTSDSNLTVGVGNSASSWAGNWANLSVNSNADAMWGLNTKIDNSGSVVVKTVNSHPDIKGGCMLWGGNGNPYGPGSLIMYVTPGVGSAGNVTLTPNGLWTADISNNLYLGVNKVTGISHNVDVGGDVGAYRLAGTSAAPTIAADTGAGTSPTVSIGSNSTDMAGIVNVTTGTTPAGTNATVVTITFNTTYGTAPRVLLQPANAITALLSGMTMVYTTETTTTFSIISGTTALTSATVYQWKYHVIQ